MDPVAGALVDEFADGAEAVGAGELGTQVPVTAAGEVGELQRSFNAMSSRLAELETELARRVAIPSTSQDPAYREHLDRYLVDEIEHVFAELLDDRLQAGCAVLDDFAREIIRVDDRDTQIREHLCDGRLPARDPADRTHRPAHAAALVAEAEVGVFLG